MSNKQARKVNGLRNRGRQAVKSDSNKNSNQNPHSVQVYRIKAGATETLIKRLTSNGRVFAQAVTGLIDPTLIRSSLVTATFEWGSYAGRFLSYRMKKVRATFYPVSTNTQVFALANVASLLATSTFGANSPTLFNQIWSDGEASVHPTVGREGFSIVADWSRNPAAKLYTATTSSIPAQNDFGIAYASHPLVAITQPVTQTLIYAAVFEFICEFKDPA